MVKEISQAQFNDVLSTSAKPVMVDFWAPWCRPCRAISPVIDELEKEYAESLEVYKVNVDDCPDLPEKYSIRAIPTVIVYKGGEVAERVTGAVSKESLKEMIGKALG